MIQPFSSSSTSTSRLNFETVAILAPLGQSDQAGALLLHKFGVLCSTFGANLVTLPLATRLSNKSPISLARFFVSKGN